MPLTIFEGVVEVLIGIFFSYLCLHFLIKKFKERVLSLLLPFNRDDFLLFCINAWTDHSTYITI
jgi:hypothetical protein